MLLEAFIAILLFSMGILALVGVQATAIKHAADAKYRAEAAHLANQIIAQMWADIPGNLPTYVLNATTTGPCNFTGAPGNANVEDWLGSASTPGTVHGNLPGATKAMQQIVVGANNAITVTLCWQTPGETTPHTYVGVAQINEVTP
jgi:type IV pilus assembly protein PilV